MGLRLAPHLYPGRLVRLRNPGKTLTRAISDTYYGKNLTDGANRHAIISDRQPFRRSSRTNCEWMHDTGDYTITKLFAAS